MNCFSQTIRGKVIDTDTKMPLANSYVYLVQADNRKDTIDIYYWRNLRYKILEQTKTDSLGKYSFVSLVPKIYNIVADFPMQKSEFGGYGVRQEIDSNINIKAKTNYYKIFYLMITCPYDKTKNQLFCPNCKKADKVVPILFGLPLPDKNGDIDGKSLEEYHLGGCFVDSYCNPTKHCNRCNKDF